MVPDNFVSGDFALLSYAMFVLLIQRLSQRCSKTQEKLQEILPAEIR